ncbi:tyrosine-type recombinase/integrase [Actinophytocola sp.]|uniref:tyrosine-type recombinase/integrase n=1 Tax=Actinophytocola sp. TaxID=1872138 RepID=UPI002D34CE1B|nr:tyrosine-type recombinase/integrase [Actinophytocola sp.]HYQ64689.1 tyrosine-type recombinase/integrase [Actinophytocola sp.]
MATTFADLEARERGVHFHDLRHSGNTWAAQAGTSTKDLMVRIGHDDMRAAIIYQHPSTPAPQHRGRPGHRRPALGTCRQTPGEDSQGQKGKRRKKRQQHDNTDAA